MKLGIVGCGGISFGQHGPASLATDNIRFAACCDVREDAAHRFAEKDFATNFSRLHARCADLGLGFKRRGIPG